jgi:hypothetical protein
MLLGASAMLAARGVEPTDAAFVGALIEIKRRHEESIRDKCILANFEGLSKRARRR